MTGNRMPRDEIRWCSVENLRLDPRNPRLARALRDASEEDLLKALHQSHDLEPLILSFAQSGYFTQEPLIGVPQDSGTKNEAAQQNGEFDDEDHQIDVGSGDETNHLLGLDAEGNDQLDGGSDDGTDQQDGDLDDRVFVVVEGNRRLAALKILLFDWAQKAVDISNLPDVGEEVRLRLNPVPVKEYASREEVIPYLGVRHIRGSKDWEALAKARYVEDLKEAGYSLREIARLVGDRGDVVQRWLLTLYVLDQANRTSETPWNEAIGEFKFSWLYTSLGYARIRQFLGLEENSRQDPQPDPINDSFTRPLIDHMQDLYGPPPGDPSKAAVPESRHIRRLAAVYASTEALDVLRGGGSLEDAYSRSSGEHEELLDHLRQANVSLERANGMAHRHTEDAEAIRRAEQAAGTANNIVRVLKG